MEYNNLGCVNSEEEGFVSKDEEERESGVEEGEGQMWSGERSRCKLSPTL